MAAPKTGTKTRQASGISAKRRPEVGPPGDTSLAIDRATVLAAEVEQVAEADRAALHEEQEIILAELKALREEIRTLRLNGVVVNSVAD